MANLQNYFQEIVTCTATLKFRVQIIQKVGSSTEIKVRLCFELGLKVLMITLRFETSSEKLKKRTKTATSNSSSYVSFCV